MRSNRKYSFDEKVNILSLIDSNHTVQSIVRKFRINENVIYQWKRLYDLNGSEGLRHKRKNRSYSQAFKEKIVQEHIKEKESFPKLATKYDLSSAGMVSNWLRDYTIGKKTYPI